MEQLNALVPLLEKTSFQLLNVVYGLLALVIGLLIARIFEKIFTVIFQAIKFDELMKTVRFTHLLEKGDIKKSPSELVGAFVYWVIVYVLIVGVAFILGLPIEAALEKIFNSLLLILLAVLVLSLGTFFSIIFGNVVYVILANFGLQSARTIARLTQYATVVVAFLLALEQLGVGATVLVPSAGVIIGALGLAVAIAFGLGCKDIMADFVSNLIKGK